MSRVTFSEREQALEHKQEETFTDLGIIGSQPALLDVGCSDFRRYSVLSASLAQHYTGLEIDFATLAAGLARKPVVGPVLAVNGSAELLPFPNDCFDVVLLNDMLAYCDKPGVIAETSRVLKPGGYAISLHNNTIEWSLYKLFHPEKPLLVEWVHSLVVILNTLVYRLLGVRAFHTTFSSGRELRRLFRDQGLDILRSEDARNIYRVHHLVARKPKS